MPSQPLTETPTPGLDPDRAETLDRIARRALAQMAYMVWEANHRPDADPTDPKVGGHPAACASSLHLDTALLLEVRRPQDFWCAKPHLAPLDHALNALAGVFRRPDGSWMADDEAAAVLHRLRKYPSTPDEVVLQSYHADSDPDSWRVLPSGTLGIPPVASGYLALALRYLRDHGWADEEDVHFWSLIGDSEFREGSLMEAVTDFAERGLHEVTWILDYNRQNLDGERIVNDAALPEATDADRIEETFRANGWDVLHLRHGRKRMQLFERPGGELLRQTLERGLTDFETQALLWKAEAGPLREHLLTREPGLGAFLDEVADDELVAAFLDLGGHDLVVVAAALEHARRSERPTLVLAHTIKGWGLRCQAAPGNHSTVPDEDEVRDLLAAEGLSLEEPYGRGDWAPDGPETALLESRRETWRAGVAAEEARVAARRDEWNRRLEAAGELPHEVGIDLKMMPVAHTQWMLGQVLGRLVRIATWDEYRASGRPAGPEPDADQRRFAAAGDLLLTMSPDVGTSTNINPTMDGKVYGAVPEDDWESELGYEERGRPHLYPTTRPWTRHVRFEIAEAAAMSAMGAFGKAGDFYGVPLFPAMTVYDFFVKRALDQLYYDVYWGGRFLLVGTPSGITLSPEGAQHSWKSDVQMPNLVTWEPYHPREMEWILVDALRRRVAEDDDDRRGVYVRGVTRGVRTKEWTRRLMAQARHTGRSEAEVLAEVRRDVLAGGYWLVHREGEEGYAPGENVVVLLVMGAPATEAAQASDRLLELGIHANVLVCTSPELLLGRLAAKDGHRHLRDRLGVDGALHLTAPSEVMDRADAVLLGARQVPIVGIVDGEPGILDNAGSVLGVPQRTLAVEKFTKSGRPVEVYGRQGFDVEGIVRTAGRVLAESALREVRIEPRAAADLAAGRRPTPPPRDWRELWPY